MKQVQRDDGFGGSAFDEVEDQEKNQRQDNNAAKDSVDRPLWMSAVGQRVKQ